MLKYVYALCEGGNKKIPCSARDGNLPDFGGIGETEESYEKRLLQYEEYLEWFMVQNEKRLKYEELFYKNLGFLIDNYAKILPNPRFASILWPRRICGMMYADFEHFRKITLGEIISVYLNEPKYCSVCPKCGGKMFLTYFGGSPLSGIVYEAHYICSTCNNRLTDKTQKLSHGELRKIREKYLVKHENISPFHIAELVDFLNNGSMPSDVETPHIIPIYHSASWLAFTITSKKPIECALKRSGSIVKLDFDYNKQSQQYTTHICENKLCVSIPERCWTPKFKQAVKKAGHKGFIGKW